MEKYTKGNIVWSKVKFYVKQKHDLNVGEEVRLELERIVNQTLNKAASRAKKNFRKTLYARDI